MTLPDEVREKLVCSECGVPMLQAGQNNACKEPSFGFYHDDPITRAEWLRKNRKKEPMTNEYCVRCGTEIGDRYMGPFLCAACEEER